MIKIMQTDRTVPKGFPKKTKENPFGICINQKERVRALRGAAPCERETRAKLDKNAPNSSDAAFFKREHVDFSARRVKMISERSPVVL